MSDSVELKKIFNGLVSAGFLSLFLKLISAILSFFLSVTLARMLGPDNLGVYAFALAVITVLALPAHIGLPQLVLRETARAHVEHDWPLMIGYWRKANRFALFISVVMFCAVNVVLSLLDRTPRAETILIGVLLIPVIALSNIRSASLRGLRKVILGQLPESVFKPLAMLFSLMLAVFLGLGNAQISAQSAMVIHVISAIFALIVGAAMLQKWRARYVGLSPPKLEVKIHWTQSVLPFAMVAGFQLINNQADIIVLSLFRQNEEVGVYRVVFQTALLTIFGMQALNQIVQPNIVRLHQLGELSQLKIFVRRMSWTILLISFPIGLVLILFGEQVLELIFGPPYRNGAIALAILVVAQIVKSATGLSISLLNMTGNEKIAAKLGLSAVLINILLNFSLIPVWGGIGAAIATCVSVLVWQLLSTVWVYKQLGIKTLSG